MELVSKEVERRSLYTILSKPVRRREVVLRKYVGLVFTLAVIVVAVYAVLGYMSVTESEEFMRDSEAPATNLAMLTAFFLIFVQLMLVTAIALFFSTFSGSIVATGLTCGLYIVGHFNADLRGLEDVVDAPIAGFVAKALSYVLPDLAAFDVSADVVHAQPVTVGYVLLTVGYGFAYISALLVGAMAVFSRRDLT